MHLNIDIKSSSKSNFALHDHCGNFKLISYHDEQGRMLIMYFTFTSEKNI